MTLSTAYLPSANQAIRDGCPDRLAVVATLFGLTPALPERCRVLEIGCAEGVHLAALALNAPASRHLGVDLDPRAVEKGSETLRALGLDNVSLECADFRELAKRDERFDYVIAHGMYSWLPSDVRDALLSVIHDALEDGGIGYVSYVAETNEPVALAHFVEHLGRHGLEYLADASTLDRPEMRGVRQALVRRRGAPASLDFARAESLWFASSAEPAARGAVQGSGPVRFKTVAGLELETTVPALKLALYELGRVWPAALGLGDLSERVSVHLGSASNAPELARLLFDSAASVAVRAFSRPPRSVHAPSRKPAATSLARLEATRGSEVTNLHHEPVKIDVPFHRKLLGLLDGTRERDALAQALADELESGALSVPGIEPGARSRWEALIPREVDAGLERLARYALLLA